MKLLNCKSLKIEEFSGKIPEPYAILSHRWEEDNKNEITYQDFQADTIDKQKVGWNKIRNFCRVALHNDYKYVWIDTCCINKEDLTELTESINSMFKWYANSAVCYTYLSDVTLGQSIQDSLWFTRGWTLQELIAPPKMEFFDKDWNLINTRTKLRGVIQERTRVATEILDDESRDPGITAVLEEYSVACRMSWASGRTTTREEDRAYSLLGIFGVSMPLLYGESSLAFVRLQEEIVKKSNDMSLFAWRRWERQSEDTKKESDSSTLPARAREPCGILAVSPDEFRSSYDIVLRRDIKYNPEFTITNKGLKITKEAMVTEENVWRISLGCRAAESSNSHSQDTIGILLKGIGGGVFVRWDANSLIPWRGDNQGHEKTFYIKTTISPTEQKTINSQLQYLYRCSFQFHAKGGKVTFDKAMPALNWIKEQNTFITEGQESFEGFIICNVDMGVPYGKALVLPFVVACGYSPGVKKWVCIGSTKGANDDLYKAAEDGDLYQVGVLGTKASQSKSNATKSSLGFGRKKGRIKIKEREDGSEALDVFVSV